MTKSKSSGRKKICQAIAVLGITWFGGINLDAQGTAGMMRDITPKQLVYDMKIGWNLGTRIISEDLTPVASACF